MDNRQITSLALKLFGLYLLTGLILRLPELVGLVLVFADIGTNAGDGIDSRLVLNFVLMLSILATAWLARIVWKMSNRYSGVVAADGGEAGTRLPADFEDAVLVALGLYLFAEALLVLPVPVKNAIVEIAGNDAPISGDTTLWLFAEISKAALGSWLMLRPASAWRLIRTSRRRLSGTPAAEESKGGSPP